VSRSNLELARRGYEALKRGDLGEAATILDEQVKWHSGDPTAKDACHNRAQALGFLQRPGRPPLPDVVDMIDAGDRVVVILRPPTSDGEPAPLRAQITTFRDGKVVEMAGYPTVEAALDAAGVSWPRERSAEPPPASPQSS
jgi:ketosteroid isomerase-like protein